MYRLFPILCLLSAQVASAASTQALTVRDSKHAVVGRLAKASLTLDDGATIVLRDVGGTLAPLVVTRAGIVGGTTPAALVHAAANCADAGLMLPADLSSLAPSSFLDRTTFTYGTRDTTVPQIGSATLFSFPADVCLQPWVDATPRVLPGEKCCLTWREPIPVEGVPFAVPATVDIGTWKLVPPFTLE